MTLEENPIYQNALQLAFLGRLTPAQQSRVQWYMREQGMAFENAYRLMLDPPAPCHSSLVRLVSINLPTPTTPRGRRLTRRQRRQQ